MPKLSVSIITFNHDPFIRQCLDSALAQVASFPIEIVLGEDDSTDATRSICRDYAARHPDVIRLLLNDRSTVTVVDGKPTGNRNFLNNLRSVRGEYVAILDGDDYWIDPEKLDLQVRFLDRNQEYSGCIHSALAQDEEGIRSPETRRPPGRRSSYVLEDMLRNNFVVSSSLVFRAEVIRAIPDEILELSMADWPLHLLNLRAGPYAYLDRTMSVYRVHAGGIWSQRTQSERAREVRRLYSFAKRHLGSEYRGEVRKAIWWRRLNKSVVGRSLRPLRKRLKLRTRLGWLLGRR